MQVSVNIPQYMIELNQIKSEEVLGSPFNKTGIITHKHTGNLLDMRRRNSTVIST